MSIASEEPVARWYGLEVLSIDKKAIRTERLRRRAPLLVGHDTSDQVGVIEDFEITASRRLRVKARFSRSARAEEIWQDVLDGIRVNTSIAYVVHDIVLEKRTGDVETYRVTDMEPLEASLVPIPADTSVGVGRSNQSSEKGTHIMEEHDNAGAPLSRRERRALAHGEEHHASNQQSEQFDLIAAGREYREYGGVDIADRVARAGGNMEDFRREILAAMRTKTPPTATAEPFQSPYLSGAREVLPVPKYFTGPDAQQRAYRAGMWLKSKCGNQDAARWCADHGVRAMSGEVLSQGGALVPEELSSAIIDLADTHGTFRGHGDKWPMRSDTLVVPKRTSDPTAAFVSESGLIPEGSSTWGVVNLVARKIGRTVKIPVELMEDAVIPVADEAAFELSRAFMKCEDETGFLGDGTSAYGGMRGIIPLLTDGSHDAGTVTAATNHNTLAEIDATDLTDLMAALPEYALDNAKWYCSGTVWHSVFGRLLRGLTGNAVSDVSGRTPKYFAGYPVVTSPVLPSSATANYTGEVILLFGDLKLSSKFGSRRDITIKVLNERYSDYDQVGIQGTERFVIVNHDLGTNSIAGPLVGLVGA